MDKKTLKQDLREKTLKLRDQLIDKELQKHSKKILERLSEQTEFIKAKKILLYFPIRNEVNTVPLMEDSFETKEVYLPKIHEDKKIFIHRIKSLDELQPGKYDIPEPDSHCPIIPADTLDLIIMPGVAFDKKGIRIGYGGGYYDRFLKNTNCPKIALAYDFQIHENVPGEIHDEKVDLIITEKDIIHTHL